MNKNKSKLKFIACAVLGCFVLSTQSLALAYSKGNTSDFYKEKSFSRVQNNIMKGKAHHKERLKEKLDELVKSEVITKDQQDKILDKFKKKHEDRKEEVEKLRKMTEKDRKKYIEQVRNSKEKDIFEELVDDKIINKEQAEAVKIVMFKKYKHEFNADKWKSKLDEQVKAGVIDQTEADRVLGYMKKKAEDRKAIKEKLEKMTPGEKRAFFLEKKLGPKNNLFTELVEQKILSEDKAKALKKSMHKNHKSHKECGD